MRIVPLAEVEPRPRRIAVGCFDGVHVGHREVIRGADCVLTFDPHPLCVVRPEAAPKLLTTMERKAAIIASLGVEELVVIPFDHAFAARSAQEFVDDVLVGALGATQVSVGENFRFGQGARGDARALAGDPRFTARVVELLEVDGEVVSSSRVRRLVAAGDVEAAARLLGEPFTLRGEVVQGDTRGRTLGYPTANLVPDERFLTPPHGVYACVASAADGPAELPAAVNIGLRPTFVTGLGELIEAFVVDWSGDLYGATLELAFLRRLRGEQRFDSVDELVDQMALDVAQTRSIAAERNAARRLLRFDVA
jgi:riboflavin kinase/FMN adenylyltransferase